MSATAKSKKAPHIARTALALAQMQILAAAVRVDIGVRWGQQKAVHS